MNGYNAFSLSKTGRDSRGYFLPALMHGFGNLDFRSPLYAYLSVPAVWILGLNETSTRIVGLVSNVALLVLVFVFTRRLFQRTSYALAAVILLVPDPWNLHFSRVGHEAAIGPFFYFASILLLRSALTRRRGFMAFALAGLSFGLTTYTYQVARMMSPGIFLWTCLIYRREAREKWRQLVTAGVVGLAVVFPMIHASVIAPGPLESRFAQVTILGHPDVVPRLIASYLVHFSPGFLFLHGAPGNMPASDGAYGMLQPYLLPLIFLGLLFLTLQLIRTAEQRREILFLFGLALIYPLPAALTFPAPHALRAYTLVPVFHVLGAVGLCWGVRALRRCPWNQWVKGALLAFAVAVLGGISADFLRRYYTLYPKATFGYYQYGMKEVGEFLLKNESRFSKVYVTAEVNQPFIYVLFYTQFDPRRFQTEPKDVDYRAFGRVDHFDKYHFLPDRWMPASEESCLYVTRTDRFPKRLLEVIRDPNNTPCFFLWSD